jgi:Mor family transcriptional regulator
MQKVLKELSAVVGFADAIVIARRWSGRVLNVPQTVESGDPLALTLTLETARKLVNAFGGTRLQLPSERNALLDLRNEAILRARRDGSTIASICAEYGLTRQGVEHILKKMLAAEAQACAQVVGTSQRREIRAESAPAT